jgi:predicted sulfurtransferase
MLLLARHVHTLAALKENAIRHARARPCQTHIAYTLVHYAGGGIRCERSTGLR